MQVVAGAVHPAETAKALLHLEATATKNYGHRGHHKAALVSHRAWVAGLGGLSSAETAGNCIRSTNVRENRNPRKKTLAVFQPVNGRLSPVANQERAPLGDCLQWRTKKGHP